MSPLDTLLSPPPATRVQVSGSIVAGRNQKEKSVEGRTAEKKKKVWEQCFTNHPCIYFYESDGDSSSRRSPGTVLLYLLVLL